MSKKNPALEAEMLERNPEAVKTKSRGAFARFLRRFFLLLFTLVLMAVGAASLFFHTVFNGPSPTARDMFTVSLLEDSRTSWIPGVFLDKELLNQITAEQEG